MKYLNKIFLLSLVLIGMVLPGCKKSFLDANTDPNRPTDATITPELIFPQAAHATGVRQASPNLAFIENWLGYWAISGDYAPNQQESTYNIDFNFGNVLWVNQYDVLFDLYQTKTKALANGNDVLAGASMILSARLFQDLVDTYGDLPYSQAFQYKQYPLPVFDKAKDVYAALQKSLDSAIGYMQETAPKSFSTVDIVTHGDQDLWIRFANTLKLRLLIRQSEISGFDPSAELAKIKTNGSVLQQGQTISVNPGYTNDNNKQSPFYAKYGRTPQNTEVNPINRANSYFISLLNSTSDPRIGRYFKLPSSGGTQYVGTQYGLEVGANPSSNGSSGMGPGLAGSPSQNQWIFTSFESLFLQAEAVTRGWLDGDPQTAYENAVTESFVWLGVPDSLNKAATYLSTIPIAKWSNSGGSVAEQVRFIAYQKYIALNGTDPLEAWSDLRRLNMIPNNGYLSVNPGRTSNIIPVRLLYPLSEFTTNGNNVPKGINQFTSKIFWQP